MVKPMHHTDSQNSHRHAFTLIELSIVIVIIGILVGGILGGQSLIRNAEIKTVISEVSKYKAAAIQFKDQYNGLPGDLADANSYWTGANPGNGDGVIGTAAAASATGEMFEFWNHLTLAGLISGKYTGLAGAGSAIDSIPGTNIPKSRITNSGWSIYNLANYGGDASTYAFDYGNQLLFGSVVASSVTDGSILTPTEAWNVDTKVDDGKPGSGKMLVRENGTWAGASKCTTSTSNTDYAGAYNLTNSAVICALKFANPF